MRRPRPGGLGAVPVSRGGNNDRPVSSPGSGGSRSWNRGAGLPRGVQGRATPGWPPALVSPPPSRSLACRHAALIPASGFPVSPFLRTRTLVITFRVTSAGMTSSQDPQLHRSYLILKQGSLRFLSTDLRSSIPPATGREGSTLQDPPSQARLTPGGSPDRPSTPQHPVLC